ncbi:MAG: ATP-dependent helicase/nuclease AddAB, subunit B [Firmicutes bacterium]|nr:ATP-dependent helicase/nuclease AddAB, subunit B [Bacillota bacterium]
MTLRIIYGRAGSGKTHFCLNEIKSKLISDQWPVASDQWLAPSTCNLQTTNYQLPTTNYQQGMSPMNPLILVVPEQFTLQAEKSLVSMTGTGGIIRAEVLSFRRMAYRVFNEVGGAARRHINPAGKCMLLLRIIDELKDNLEIFSTAASQQGFTGVLSGAIAEFKRYNVAPDDLNRACEMMEEGLLKCKIRELSHIYRRFNETLHERYIDADDDLTLLAERLDRSVQFDGAEIWIDGFSGFTPQEYKVVEKLMMKAQRVSVSLCTDCIAGDYTFDGTDVFSPVKRTASRLIDIARENGVVMEKPVELGGNPLYRLRGSNELLHLESKFFTFPHSPYTGKTNDISVFMASSIYSEVENTARDIIRLCRDEGMRYRDIAVVMRNLAGYEKLVSAIFSQYGIPCFIDRKKQVSSHPLVQLILSALEIFVNSWSYEAVFRYLKTGLTGIARRDIDMLENYVLACGIKGGIWTRDSDWDAAMMPNFDGRERSGYETGNIERINEIRKRVVQPLAAFRMKTRGRTKASDMCTAVYELLVDLDVPSRIEDTIKVLTEKGELNLSNEYRQIWNIAMEVLDQVAEVVGDEYVTAEKFLRLLSVGFSEYKVGLIPPALDQVLVGSVERTKSHEISALYILGVNDGVFPSVTNDEGILTDRDRETMRSIGIDLAQDTRTRAFEEQYMMYNVLSAASKYLRISFPLADHNGATLRPSIIISRLKRVFPGITEVTDIIPVEDIEDKLSRITVPLPTFNELISAARRKSEGASIDPFWADVQRWYAANDDWRRKFEEALKGIRYTNHAAPVALDKARRLYGMPVYTSISRLEKYAACPFSYYVQYGLKARERRAFDLTPPDVGTFIHNVIDRFSRRISVKGLGWRELEKEQCASEVSAIVDEILGEMSGSVVYSSSRYKYLIKRLKRILCRSVWLIAEHIKRSGFEPLGYEVAFGEDGRFPPITVELPSGDKAYLTGRIDRVDTMETPEGTYIRIVDYKSGAKTFKLSDVYHGLQVQLLAYLDALWENGGHELGGEILPGGILYFRIDDPMVKDGNGMRDEEIEEAVMKQLRMKGLVLADVNLIKGMDRNIEGDSLIIPVRLNKGEELGSRSSAATAEQFSALRKHVKKLLADTVDEILRGNVAIKPYRKNRSTPCKYCSFTSICQFDPRFRGNSYRQLRDMKDEEFWELINEKGGN